ISRLPEASNPKLDWLHSVIAKAVSFLALTAVWKLSYATKSGLLPIAGEKSGLNVIEQWNGANDFVFFARRGELVSNRRDDHEVSMLSLHLLQNCMVYINTLMMQQVLARPHWAGRLTPPDLRAVTPLIWEPVNPYGRFELDMETRLDLSPNGPW